MTVKISTASIRNTKRVIDVEFSPSGAGLTIIGGRNAQGKTSVLDAIAWALGGGKFAPSAPSGGATPKLKIELSNGLVVERVGKRSTLKVTDPKGLRAGQALLDELVGELALNIPAFMSASAKKKAEILLGILGVEEELATIEAAEKAAFEERTHVNREHKSAVGHAEALPRYDVGAPVSIVELSAQLSEAHAHNAEAKRLQGRVESIERRVADAHAEVERLRAALEAATKTRDEIVRELSGAQALADVATIVDTSDIEAQIAGAEEHNKKAAANAQRAAAIVRAEELEARAAELTEIVEAKRAERMALLESARLPLAGLTIEDGELSYGGATWDNMSAAEQLRVATAIVRAVNPQCGFVLVDKLEQMDEQTLAEFASWAESEDLQIIATRVSTGDECTLILHDGKIAE